MVHENVGDPSQLVCWTGNGARTGATSATRRIRCDVHGMLPPPHEQQPGQPDSEGHGLAVQSDSKLADEKHTFDRRRLQCQDWPEETRDKKCFDSVISNRRVGK